MPTRNEQLQQQINNLIKRTGKLERQLLEKDIEIKKNKQKYCDLQDVHQKIMVRCVEHEDRIGNMWEQIFCLKQQLCKNIDNVKN